MLFFIFYRTIKNNIIYNIIESMKNISMIFLSCYYTVLIHIKYKNIYFIVYFINIIFLIITPFDIYTF